MKTSLNSSLRLALLCSLSTAAVAGGVMHLRGPRAGGGAPPRTPQAASSRAGAASAGWRPSLAYKWPAGERRIFDLSFETSGQADLGPALQGNNKGGARQVKRVGFVLTGEVALTALQRDAETVELAYEFLQPAVSLSVDDKELPAQARLLEQGLGQGCKVRVDRRGRVQGLLFKPGTQPMVKRSVRGVLAAIHLELPEDELAEAWEAQEQDLQGVAVARYAIRQRGPAAQVQISKRKASYLSVSTQVMGAGGAARPRVDPETDISIAFDQLSGTLKAVKGTERHRLTVGAQTISDMTTTAHLTEQRSEAADVEGLRRRLEGHVLASADDREDMAEALRRAHLERLRGRSVQTLLAELDQAAARGGDAVQESFRDLVALTTLRPEDCAVLGEKLKRLDPGKPQMQAMVGALHSVGSKEAQAALAGALRARPDDQQADGMLITALGMVEQPTRDTEDALRGVIGKSGDKDLVGSAELMMGAIARSLGDSEKDRERARRIVKETLGELAATRDAGRREQLLLVLGNIGTEELLPALQALLQEGSSGALRAQVAWALRLIQGGAADALLLALLKDPDAEVRRAATQALRLREITQEIYAGLTGLLSQERSPILRIELLQTIWQARGQFPGAAGVLSRAAQSDADADVRRFAGECLSGQQARNP